VYVNKSVNRVTIKTEVKTVPELKGNLRLFTKKTSRYPNRARVEGKRSLKIKSKTVIERIFAIKKLFKLGFGYFLKK
jgi:hypothetical protein